MHVQEIGFCRQVAGDGTGAHDTEVFAMQGSTEDLVPAMFALCVHALEYFQFVREQVGDDVFRHLRPERVLDAG